MGDGRGKYRPPVPTLQLCKEQNIKDRFGVKHDVRMKIIIRRRTVRRCQNSGTGRHVIVTEILSQGIRFLGTFFRPRFWIVGGRSCE